MRKTGDILAFVDPGGRAVYGRVLSVIDDILVILDTDGCFHRVQASATSGAGQADAEGSVLMASTRVAYEVAQKTEPYLNDPMVEMVMKRIGRRVGLLGKADGSEEKNRRYHQSYQAIPLRMFTGRQLDEAGYPRMTIEMERYLFGSDERRQRQEGLLRRLKERAPTQWLVLVCMRFRGMRQADVCKVFDLDPGNVSKQYRLASDWFDTRMGTRVSGTESSGNESSASFSHKRHHRAMQTYSESLSTSFDVPHDRVGQLTAAHPESAGRS